MTAQLREERNGITFLRCLIESMETSLPNEWEKLSGYKLSNRSAIEKMIDEATGYEKFVIEQYIQFVYEFIFLRF